MLKKITIRKTAFRNTILFVSLFCLNKVSLGQDTVSFYFSAHEDDWQLFMNPNAYNDVHKPNSKVVFVYLTAGDAGLGLGKGERSQPYYLARENGAKLSVKFMVDAKKEPSVPVSSASSFLGHPVTKWVYGNTVSYFLRLPDGNPQGTGYATTGQQSLKRLADGVSASMMAVDSSATYKGWSDLKATLRVLIDQESGKASTVSVNIPDTDTKKNSGDHQDHLHTAKLVLESVADQSCISKFFYLNYVTAKMPENMTAADHQVEVGTFAALVVGLTALDHDSPWDGLHRSWLSRHYFRTEPGTGKCQ